MLGELLDTAFKIAVGILRDEQAAKDVAHDVVVSYLEKDDEVRRPHAYFAKAAKHKALNVLRQDKGHAELTEHDAGSFGDSIAVRNLMSRAKLTREQAEIINLVFFIGYSFQEAAELLGISKTAAWRRWNRAREKVREVV